jgi:hypothetical protein
VLDLKYFVFIGCKTTAEEINREIFTIEINMEKTEKKLLNILLAEELINRVNAVCDDQDMSIQEFVTDAIIEKLNLFYKERRKKDRL